MQCPRCQQENPPQAKFCLECAAPLARRCSNCGTPLPAGAKFCFECATPVSTPGSESRSLSPEAYTPRHLAEKILTSKAALEGERKQVTVLFADLKGSMELLANRDPEEARKLLDPILERMMEAVHRYEGTVNQVMGDGIMALFGAPIAHEDHAVRACYAALRMQEAVKRYAEETLGARGPAVRIRVGLNSGEVVVRAIGSDLHMDYTAVGQTSHLAARMEQIAEPGTILITTETLRLSQGYIQTEDKGPVQVKGLGEPVAVHELTGADLRRTRLQVAALSGLTRFVARDPELEQLQRALDRAARGHGQVVTVVGEPGVGKSRLFHEFIRSPRTQGWLVLESSSLSHDKITPHLPIIYLLRAYFQIQDTDDPLKIHEKISGRLIALEQSLWAMLPAFLFVLGLSTEDPQWATLEPSQRRRQVLEACRHLLVRESQIQPVLIALENLHWIDSETQAFLDALVESLPAARILLLVNCRPEYQHGWAGKRYYRQIQLDPLPPDAVQDLMRRLLGDDQSLRPLKQLISNQTEGNPLFVEECVRSLVETGVLIGTHGAYRLVGDPTAIRVPATVQAILAARIDRLDAEDKGLLQAASVIGKDVPFALLQAIAGSPDDDLRRRLARLQSAELLHEARLFPDLEYTFQHALTHQVAYGSLTHDRRRLLHARIAQSIEQLYPDRLVEWVDRLAHHALRGEMWEPAFGYLRQAGLKAMARSAYLETATYLEQAVEAAGHLPQDRRVIDELIDVRFDLRGALTALGRIRSALEHLHEAETLAETLQDHHRVGRIAAYMATGFRSIGEHARAIEHGRRALEIAQNLDDFALRVAANFYLGEAYVATSDYSRAVEHLTWNVERLQGDLARERFGLAGLPSVLSRTWLSLALADQGEFTTARARAEEGLQIAQAAQQPLSLVVACSGLGDVNSIQGEFSTAIPVLERGLQLAERWEISGWLDTLIYWLGYAYALTGRFAEAIPLQVASRDRLVATRGGHALASAWLGETYLLSGQIDDALRLGSEALDLARRRGERGYEALALRLLAEIRARGEPSDVEPATGLYRHASTMASELGMRPLVAHCQLGLGKLYRCTGRPHEAREHLATATTMYRDMGMTYWLEKAEAELRELARGR